MENTTTNTIKSYEALVKSLSATNDIIDIVCEELKGTMKLMNAKKSIKEGTVDSFSLPMDISRQLKDANKARTKDAYIKGLNQVHAIIDDTIKVAEKAINDIQEGINKMKEEKRQATIKSIKDSKEQTEKTEPALNQDELDRIAKEIKASIETATTSYFEAGKLLSDALDMFKAADKPAKDWLAWANTACCVKKAQAYNLVKIYKDFGQVSEFKSCSMRVLNILVHTSSNTMGSNKYNSMIEEAKTLAKAGKLDTKAVNKLLKQYKPAPKATTKTEPKSNTLNIEPDATTKAIKASIEHETPASNNSASNKDHSKSELGTSKDDTAGTADSDKDKLILELKKQNKALLDRIDELTQAVKESKKDTEPALFLPQFESDEAYLVLGISPVASKAEINKRYRSMAVIFNAKTCPKGAKALKAAKDEMLKTAK